MATQASIVRVQQAYIAYYGRAADPNGLNFWATRLDQQGAGQLNNIINAFATSAEFTGNYGNPSTTTELTTYINQIYQNVLNRDADAAGLNFYLNQLQTGKLTIKTLPLDILNGAINSDKLLIDNKTAAVLAYTNALDTTEEIQGYNSNSKQVVIDWLNTVGADPASLQTAQANIPVTISAMIIASNPGQTYDLTVNEDNITGTPANDTFNAAVKDVGGTLTNTLQSVDRLDGSTGIDRLNATLNGGTATPSLTSVEIVQVRSTQPGSTIDLGASTGVETIIAANGTGSVVFDNVGGVNKAILANQINGPGLASDVQINGGTATAFNIQADTWGSAGDPGRIDFGANAVKNLSLKVGDVNAAVIGLGAVETVEISGAGANKLWLLGPDSTATSVKVSGAGSVDLTGGAPGPATPFTGKLATFDASGNAGGVKADISSQVDTTVTGGSGKDTLNVGSTGTVTVSAGAGSDVVTVTGAGGKIVADMGDGDDKLTVSAATDVKDSSYDGGKGTDTFVASSAGLNLLGVALGLTTPTVTFKNFEVLGVSDQQTGTLDLTKFGVGSVDLTQGSGGGTVKGLADGASVGLGAASTVTLEQADTDTNTLTLKLGTSTTKGIAAAVTANSVETLTVVSDGDGTGKNSLSLADDDLNKVTITGKEALDFSTTTGKLVTLDASGAEGAITQGPVSWSAGKDASNTVALTALGGKGGDTLVGGDTFNTNTISGGDGNDNITGGSRADKLSGDAGDDTLTGLAGNDSLTGGAGNDKLFGGDGNDTLDGGDGDDQDWGGLGADAMTGGAGKDIFGYQSAQDSQGVTTDTIADFVSGTDLIGLSKAIGNVGTGGINFLGNVANTSLALSALASGAGNGQANVVYNQGDKVVLIDTAADGFSNDVNDITITLTGVSTLDSKDFAAL